MGISIAGVWCDWPGCQQTITIQAGPGVRLVQQLQDAGWGWTINALEGLHCCPEHKRRDFAELPPEQRPKLRKMISGVPMTVTRKGEGGA